MGLGRIIANKEWVKIDFFIPETTLINLPRSFGLITEAN
ncbi:hypothetical protein M595_1564 [Lyngbya aestuarii BL J]|uniref:Uncharacterized protein n=1 Tax=Lyngbya aestuarii BL J TaxID=1348334 RepID=U7QKM5_9CYAN|nr:hypothetical protein M595_1564 [Lyngbya aestuarii BL J]